LSGRRLINEPDIERSNTVFFALRGTWAYLCARFAPRVDRGEEGSVVEKVILTAVFAALAIAIGAIIVAKVTAKANTINLN
jgi:hypothetical protein